MNKLYYLAACSLISLIILNITWELFFNPLEKEGSWMVIKAIVLLLPLQGILKKNLYTYQWASMLILIFFTEGTVRLYSEIGASRYFAFFQTFLSIVFFLSTIFFCKKMNSK